MEPLQQQTNHLTLNEIEGKITRDPGFSDYFLPFNKNSPLGAYFILKDEKSLVYKLYVKDKDSEDEYHQYQISHNIYRKNSGFTIKDLNNEKSTNIELEMEKVKQYIAENSTFKGIHLVPLNKLERSLNSKDINEDQLREIERLLKSPILTKLIYQFLAERLNFDDKYNGIEDFQDYCAYEIAEDPQAYIRNESIIRAYKKETMHSFEIKENGEFEDPETRGTSRFDKNLVPIFRKNFITWCIENHVPYLKDVFEKLEGQDWIPGMKDDYQNIQEFLDDFKQHENIRNFKSEDFECFKIVNLNHNSATFLIEGEKKTYSYNIKATCEGYEFTDDDQVIKVPSVEILNEKLLQTFFNQVEREEKEQRLEAEELATEHALKAEKLVTELNQQAMLPKVRVIKELTNKQAFYCVNRSIAEELLRKCPMTYLFRDSTYPNALILSLHLLNGSMEHLLVRFIDADTVVIDGFPSFFPSKGVLYPKTFVETCITIIEESGYKQFKL